MTKPITTHCSRLGRTLLAVGLVAAMGTASIAPAIAQEWRHDDHRDDRARWEHERMERERWEREHRYGSPPVVVGPPPQMMYAPPPVVMAPPSGLSIVLPLNFR